MRSAADFRALLADEKCWDRSTEKLFECHGEGLEDAMLQNREEVIALCEFIERAGIRSYLEIGIWTGRLVAALHRIFDFDLVAACDQGYAEQLGFAIPLPPAVRLLRANCQSGAYREWRAGLGHVDLVLLDGDHRLHALRRDFARERDLPHRFIAVHDICGARPATRDVKQFWDGLDAGCRLELVRPHRELGLANSTMGIGIWSASEDPRAHAPRAERVQPGE